MSDDKTDAKYLARVINGLMADLSPIGVQTAATTLLIQIARAAEAAPQPVHGGSVIDSLAAATKAAYPRAAAAKRLADPKATND